MLDLWKSLKVSISIQVKLIKGQINPSVALPYFNTKVKPITNKLKIKEYLRDSEEELLNKTSEWFCQGSGWVIKSVKKHTITVYQYKPLRGASYIGLPGQLRGKRWLIDIRNDNDNEYYKWCHLAHLFPAKKKDLQRISKYKNEINEVDYTDIECPVKLKDIPKIEKKNDIRFNMFGFKSGYKCCIYPLYTSDKVCERTCEMLLITGEKSMENLGETINPT